MTRRRRRTLSSSSRSATTPGRPGFRTRAVPDSGKRPLTREDVHAVGTPSSMDGKILRTLEWILDIAVVLGAVAAGTAIADLMLHV